LGEAAQMANNPQSSTARRTALRSIALTIVIVAGLLAGCTESRVAATSSGETGYSDHGKSGVGWRPPHLPRGGR
jgi:hypothetical protein